MSIASYEGWDYWCHVDPTESDDDDDDSQTED